MVDRARVREALTGPISSIRTPFRRDGSVDHAGLRQVIDRNIAAGSKTMLLTAGDSHYIALSDAEIAEVSRTVVEHTAGRAMTVVADRHYTTRQAVEFAGFAADIGADVYMVLPPDWARSCTVDTLCAHYDEVSRRIPAMVVTGVFSTRGEEYGLQTLERLLDNDANVVAVKDDVCGTFARRLSLLVHGHWAVFAGGQKQNHMNMHPYGCDGYMSTFVTFKPEIAHRYWEAVCTGDLSTAAAVIRDYDLPLFELMGSSTGGFDAALHGIYELFGICERWRPPPYYSLNDEEMEELAGGLRQMGVL